MKEMSEYAALEQKLEHLSAQAEDLKVALLQRTAILFREARNLNKGSQEEYLQGVYEETPVPTTAFRMDSKDAFIEEGKISHKKLYIYLPKSHDPDTYPHRVWYKRLATDGVEAMYELGERFDIYESPRDLQDQADILEVEDTDAEVEDIVVDEASMLEDMVLKAITHKEQAINGMDQLSRDIREDYKIVPFRA